MKAYEIAAEFLAVVTADSAFAAIGKRVGMSDEDPAFPCIVFDCSTEPVGGSAHILTCEIAMTVWSDAHGDPAAHAALVTLLNHKFYGVDQTAWPAARSAIKSAINNGGRFLMLGRGHDAPSEPKYSVETTHYKTPVFLACTLKVLNPAP